MTLEEMIRLNTFYVDDVVDNADFVLLLNAGKNRMGTEVHCRFPDITVTATLDETFVFDEAYHEIPVLYAAAMTKSMDSSIPEKNSYMVQFESGLQDFVENYDPPAQYLVGPLVQQFTAADGQTNFTVTKNEYDPAYGNLKVYVNSLLVEFEKNNDKGFILETAANVGDAVTAKWELHADLSYKPALYPGW
jgi:hypothetical protein